VIRRILVATDLSDRGDRAVRRAATLAEEFLADLMLLYVVEGSQPERLVLAIERLATDELEAAARAIETSHAVSCSAKVIRGDPFDAIGTMARDYAANLLVMGTHRKDLLKDVFVGTTLERVVRMQVCPVLVANSDYTGRYGAVLAAIDFSDCSGHALESAAALGLLTRTPVTILHVSDPSDYFEVGIPVGDLDAHIATGSLKTSVALTQFVSDLELPNVEYSVRVRPGEGPPAEIIAQVAEEADVDLTVVGTHGKNRGMKVLLGSVSDGLLRRASMDLLVVPCP